MAAPVIEQLPDATPFQIETINAVSSATMTSPQRILAFCDAVEHVTRHKIPGDVVECGVWKGGSMAAAARTLVHHNGSNPNQQQIARDLWMYDTFDGMSAPTDQDVDFLGHTAAVLMDQQDPEESTSVWCKSPLDEVKETMAKTGYPSSQIRYVVGKVEDTLPTNTPDSISILRLDTDWFESTRCEMEHLFPKLQPGGILIIDDYGHWQGCRKAVDEYFEQHKIQMLLNRIDYTGRIGVYWPQSPPR
jgi:hypothetical protein